MVFAGSTYYPRGGWEDFKGYFDSKEHAINFIYSLDTEDYGWAHIVEKGDKIICKYNDDFPNYKWKQEND